MVATVRRLVGFGAVLLLCSVAFAQTAYIPGSGTPGNYRVLLTDNMTWTNMPAAPTIATANVTLGAFAIYKVNLSRFSEVRLLANKLGTAGAAASFVKLGYLGSYSQTATDYLDIGTTPASVTIDVANAYLDSGWKPLVAGAKTEVYVALLGDDGDLAADPAFGAIVAEFR